MFIINGLLKNPYYSKTQLLSDGHFILKGLPWTLGAVFLTAAFFISGYAIKINKLDKIFFKPLIALLMGLLFLMLQYFFNYAMNFADRRYDHIFISVFVVYAAIYVSIYSANKIGIWDNFITKTLKYLGRYSLIIFIFHPFIQSKVYYAGINILPKYELIVGVTAFIAGVCAPLAINYFLLERFKIFRYWYYSK